MSNSNNGDNRETHESRLVNRNSIRMNRETIDELNKITGIPQNGIPVIPKILYSIGWFDNMGSQNLHIGPDHYHAFHFH